MRSHATVYAGTSNTNKDTKIPTGPARMLVTLTVGADLIAF